jgi:TonB-linked SusC/RagA family outer membrane protein
MKTILKCFLLALCAAFPLSGYSQTMLTGNVKDGVRPLPGATVRVENENKRVVGGSNSNLNGDYRFQMPNESGTLTIVCSFIGYKTQQVKYTGQKELDFTLQEDSRMMEEVSVMGRKVDLGSTGVDKRDMGIASQKLDLGDLQTIQATSVEDMLQGQLTNVDIIASSGNPGSKMAIRIRGVNSLSASNEPLIVVDGIPYDTDINSEFDFATATEEDFGALVNIAPGDIASIEVLKDAQATAIWGSKGANGVLMITTKVGSTGNTKFSLTQKFDYKKERKPIPMLNGKEYITLMQDELWNYLRDVGYHWSRVQYLTQYPEINFDPQFKYYKEYNQNTDWMDIITRPAITSETNFSMQGGGDRARYRFSLGYLAEGGTTIGTDFSRLSTRLNVDYLFSSRLRVSSKFYFAQGERDESWKGSGSYALNPRTEARERMPNMSPYVIGSDGKPTNEYFIPMAETGYTPFQGSFPDSYNPLALVNDSKNNTLSRDVRVQFSIVFDLLPSLKYTGDVGFDIGSTATKKYLPYSVTGLNSTSAYYNRGDEKKSDKVSIYIDNRLVYNWSITEMHRVILAGLLQTSQASSSVVETAVSGLGSSQAGDPTSGGKIQYFLSDAAKSRSVGLIGNLHYNYGSRYLVNATVRHEGNSKMGRNRRWGSFATGALTWRFSEEPFLKEIEWLDESQVRGSWGFAGNSPSSSFPYIGTYTSAGAYLTNSAITPSTIQLNNLKWEKVIQKNVGLDLALFQRRVNITFDYYDKVTRDVLHQNVSLPSTTGFSSIAWMNSGKIENYGWEFRLDLNRIVRTKNFWGSFNFNISRNRNKVLELPVNKRYERYTFGNGNYAQNVVIGDPLGSFYGYRYNGVYQNVDQTVARDASGNKIYDLRGEAVRTVLGTTLVAQPGDARYEDVNHDGVIDKSDVVYLGNSMPVVIGGGGVSMGWYGWQWRALFQYRLGQKAINTARLNAESMRGRTNQSTATLKRWRREGDQTDIPRALWNTGYNTLGSDRFVDDASFLRLKQLMVSYALPRNAFRNSPFSKFEVYMSAYDLWTLTNYKGQDPEVGLVSKDGSIYQLAEDNSYTPRSPRLTLGLSVEF